MSGQRFRTREEYERRLAFNQNPRQVVGEPDIGFDPTRNYDPEPYDANGSRDTNLSSYAGEGSSSGLPPEIETTSLQTNYPVNIQEPIYCATSVTQASEALSPIQRWHIGDSSSAPQAFVGRTNYTMSPPAGSGSCYQAYTSDSQYSVQSASGLQSPLAPQPQHHVYVQAGDTPYPMYRTSDGAECGGDNEERPDEPGPSQPPPRTGNRDNREKGTGRRQHRGRDREKERRGHPRA